MTTPDLPADAAERAWAEFGCLFPNTMWPWEDLSADERDRWRKVVAQAAAAERERIGESMRTAVSELAGAGDMKRALWVQALCIGLIGRAYGSDLLRQDGDAGAE